MHIQQTQFTKQYYINQMLYICNYIQKYGIFPESVREWVVDNFAGGGGASTGIEMATGRSVDIAINHSIDAIKMHEVNHPSTKHFCESVWDVDPLSACEGNPVGLAWFSPDCKHFSKAKGGTPVDKNIRGLAWVVLRWAAMVRPRVIMLENVEEFQGWGPLRTKRDKETGRVIKFNPDYVPKNKKTPKTLVARPGEIVPFPLQVKEPHPDKKGETYHRWKKQLEDLGYEIETKIINAADFGAPTKRKRLFIIARCDGLPIVWPEPTHAQRDTELVKIGLLKPYIPAHAIIDWSIPCKSIFGRKKPLADNTMNRIARGLEKFVFDNPKPFIIQVNHSGDSFRGQSLDEPLSTITSKNGYGVVTPYITQLGQTGRTVDRNKPITEPISTVVTTKAEHCLITPTLIQYHSETSENSVRGQDIQEPVMTIDGSPRYGLVSAFISQYFAGGYTGASSNLESSLPTVTGIDHNALCTAHIIQMNNNMIGTDMREPVNTIVAGPGHIGEVRAFLIKYYGKGIGQSLNEPLGTVVTKDRFALVTIAGTQYVIVDIGLRMLEPHELYAGQGFPRDYVIDKDIEGRTITKKEQVYRCGNAVAPPVPKALVRANLPELCKGERMPHCRIDNLKEDKNRQLRFA